MSIVSVSNIRKTYGSDIKALRGVTFDVPEGSTFGLLGTNGAGKSTLLKMIVGHLEPDEGELVVAGHDAVSSGKDVREFIGFLPEHIGFPSPLTGREILEFHAKMRSIPTEEREDRIDEILSTVGISDAADRPVGGYSKGMERRLALGTALLPRPKILLLDEPTAGLDPLGVADFHDIIRSLHANTDLTVIITSHVMGEIEKLCDTLVILHEGAVKTRGDIQHLFERFDEPSRLSLTFRDQSDVDHARSIISDEYGDIESREGRKLDVRVHKRSIPNIFKELDGGRIIESYTIHDTDLEQLFKHVIEEPAENDGEGGERSANSVQGGGEPIEGTVSSWHQKMLLIADQEMRLSFKNRWAAALTGLITVLAGFLILFSGSSIGPSSFPSLIVSLTSLGTYLIPLIALVFGYDAIVGSAENGWLNVVFALPVRRSTAVLGTYLGRAVVLAGSTAIGFGVAAILLILYLGVFDVGVYGLFLTTAVLLGLSLLSIAFHVSTVASEKTHALGFSLLVWLWFVLIHDLVALGIIATVTLPTEVLSAFILANPVDIFRVIILESVNARGGGFAEVFATTDLSVPILLVGLVAWITVPLVMSSYLIDRRGL